MIRTGFFSGSFDPMTNGHLDVIDHASTLCDRLVIGVGSNPNKVGLFTVAERLALIREAATKILEGAGCALDVLSFSGLAIEAARAAGATIIFRGLRDSTDFDYEMQMAQMNYSQAGVETLFVTTNPLYAFLSSSLVKEFARYGGDVTGLIPEIVNSRLKSRLAEG